MSKPRRITKLGVCAYCGKKGPVEDEHVVPESLFVDVNQATVLVPACETCNRTKSKGEDDLRDYMVLSKRVVEHPVADALVPRIKKSTDKGFSLVGRAAQEATWQPHYSKAGIYLGPEITADTSAVKFLIPTLQYLVRGLYFHERKEMLLASVPVQIFIVPPEKFYSTLRSWGAHPHPEPRVLGDKVFWWVPYIPDEAPLTSGWVMCFYDGLLVVGTTSVAYPKEPRQRRALLTKKSQRRLDRLAELGLVAPPLNDYLETIAFLFPDRKIRGI